MKILQIPTGGLFSDGINSFIVEYVTAMDKSEMDIRVLATNNAEESTLQRVKESGCEVVSIPYRKQNIIKYFFKLFNPFWRALRVIVSSAIKILLSVRGL